MEELMPVFRTVLPRHCNRKYEFDELLAEVWLQGKVQKLPDIRLAYKVVNYGAIDYMREQEGRSYPAEVESQECPHCGQQECSWLTRRRAAKAEPRPRPKKRVRFRSLEGPITQGKNPLTLGDTLPAATADVGESLQRKEEIEALVAGCTRTERLIVTMLSEGFTQAAIARVAGYESSRLSQIAARYRKTLSDRLGRYDGAAEEG